MFGVSAEQASDFDEFYLLNRFGDESWICVFVVFYALDFVLNASVQN